MTVGRQHSRGCEWREAVCLLAKQATTWELCPQKAKHLLRNLSDISSILYTGEEERTPKMILRMTLLVWRCFALIREIAGDSPKTCSREALYGGYLHEIPHGPTQLSVVNLLSRITEALERIQGQAKAVALACTGRRHQYIPLLVLTRLPLQSQNAARGATGISKVSKVATLSPPPPPPSRPFSTDGRPTIVNRSAVDCPYFFALMTQCSTFLVKVKGVWWHKEEDILIFHDGHDDLA